jgi:hypothetical protein
MSVSNCFSAWLYADHTTGYGPGGGNPRRLLWNFFSGGDASDGKGPMGARLPLGPATFKSLVGGSSKGTAKQPRTLPKFAPFPLPNLLGASWLFPVNGLGLQSFCPVVAPSSQSDEALFVFRGQDCIKEVDL